MDGNCTMYLYIAMCKVVKVTALTTYQIGNHDFINLICSANHATFEGISRENLEKGSLD